MTTAHDILETAKARGDEIAREALPVVPMKDCRRCRGTGTYTYVSGAVGACISCTGGKVPATREAEAIVRAARVDRELRRLRVMWAGCRDALGAGATGLDADGLRADMRAYEAHAAAAKADPRTVL